MIVEIEWLDAACEHENLTVEEAEKINPVKRHNVGYLICENDEKVIISFGSVNDIDKEGFCYQDILVVPRGDVKKIFYLAYGEVTS